MDGKHGSNINRGVAANIWQHNSDAICLRGLWTLGGRDLAQLSTIINTHSCRNVNIVWRGARLLIMRRFPTLVGTLRCFTELSVALKAVPNQNSFQVLFEEKVGDKWITTRAWALRCSQCQAPRLSTLCLTSTVSIDAVIKESECEYVSILYI